MNWTALVPIKPPADRKMRLASDLTAPERVALSEHMLSHVLDVLLQCAMIERIMLLSSASGLWDGPHIRDLGRGLNDELMSAREDLGRTPLLVLHADLPLLAPADVADLVDRARLGVSIAPDRHGAGTNAVAIADRRDFNFRFGLDSFSQHLASQDGPSPAVVRRQGLAFDVDTMDDLKLALRRGGLPRWNSKQIFA